jgi:hypothetical protein
MIFSIAERASFDYKRCMTDPREQESGLRQELVGGHPRAWNLVLRL